MLSGVNRFLQSLDITFRRDPNNLRPRINKLNGVRVGGVDERGRVARLMLYKATFTPRKLHFKRHFGSFTPRGQTFIVTPVCPMPRFGVADNTEIVLAISLNMFLLCIHRTSSRKRVGSTSS